jgi:L-lactate dehydrogenase complex protein LldF
LRLWAFAAKRPALYRAVTGALSALLGGKGRYRRLPFMGGWTQSRDFPAPARQSFLRQWSLRGKNDR